MSDTLSISRTVTIIMSDASSIDVKIDIGIRTEYVNCRSNQKIAELIAEGSIDDIERSIVQELYDDEDEDEDEDGDDE